MNKPILINIALFIAGIAAGWVLNGRLGSAGQPVGATAYTITAPDGDETVELRDGNIRKKIDVEHFTGDFFYTQDAATTLDSTRNQVIFANSDSNAVTLTIPTAPVFEQQLLIYFDYTASNKIFLAGGVTDSVASDQTRLYIYDKDNTAWRNVTL